MYSSIWGNEKSPRIKNLFHSTRNGINVGKNTKEVTEFRKEVEEKENVLRNGKNSSRCPRENRPKWHFNKEHWRKVGKQPKNLNGIKNEVKTKSQRGSNRNERLAEKQQYSYYWNTLRGKNNERELIIKIIIHKNSTEIETKHLNLHIKMAPWVPGEIKPEWFTLRHTPIKLWVFKERDKFFKVSRQKR